MSKIAFIAIALLCAMGLPPDAQAQEYHGGPLEGSYVQYPTGGPLSMDPGCLVGLNVVLHILRGPQGEGGITTNEALASFEYLNDVFSAYNITFVHLDDQNPVRVHNLPNYQYWPLPEDAGLTVTDWYRESNAINIYYVDGANNEGWLGFTTSRSAADMFIRTGYQTLYPMIHEMGHCFGLRHTHGDSSSHDELVTRGPGANCETAGDKLCDTPAEPWNNDGGIRTYVNMSCEFTGVFKDANDEYYTPDTHNYMSYTNIHDCYTHFSAGQVALMRSYIANDQFLIFQTIAGQTVRFANIVGGQEHGAGDIRIYDQADNAFHTATSPFEVDLPTCISYSAHTLSERLLSQASVYEKHQTWNQDFSTFKLKKSLSIPMSPTVWDEEAWFHTMSPITLTVESDGGSLEPNILFKDPWFMETDGSQPVSFLPFAAPYSPTGARSEQAGGVFEHVQDQDFPTYLYQANRYLDGNLDAKQLPLEVGDWVCTGMRSIDAKAEVLESAAYPDLVDTRFASSLTRVVQVNQDNAEITAEYKAHRCSVNNERPSAGNSQRRIVYDKLDATLQQADRHYAVYESDGRIYLLMSEDAGVSWSAEAPITDRAATCKRPSLAIADYDEAPGLLYLVYVDESNGEVVLQKRESWSSLTWTEIDRIEVTDPELCHPSVAALVISGGVPAVATVWEDVGVVIPPSQTATNALKLSIYEDDAPRTSQYHHNGQTQQGVVFRDFVFAEGTFDWLGRRLQPKYPEVILKQPWPRIGVAWREDPGRLLYDDIVGDPLVQGILINNEPAEWIPSTGIKTNTAASLCVRTPEYGASAIAYQAEDGWSAWPSATQAVSWPLMLGNIPVHPLPTVGLLWPLSQGVALKPSRVYVRPRSGMDDYRPYKGNAWSTVARVMNLRNTDNTITAPSLGSEGGTLRVAVNDGFGGISVGVLDALQDVSTSHINDGYDPNVTIRGALHEIYSLPRQSDPRGYQHSLLSGNYGFTKAPSTVTHFMREVTVLQDSSFAVYGICNPQMLLCDSTHIALEWEYETFDTVAVIKDAPLAEMVRTASFGVTAGAHVEYATEVFARHPASFASQFDFRLEFVDAQTEEVLLAEALNVSALPTDSAWYVLYRKDISSLEGKTVYMRMDMSDTSSVYTIDIADIYDVSSEVGKAGEQRASSVRPEHPALHQNYPNPFNPSTTISFTLAEDGPVQLHVYDTYGRLVSTLLSRDMEAGTHSVVFAPATCAGGVYYYQLVSHGQRMTRRMLMLK